MTKITFVNGKSKCGCEMEYSDGHGEYSEVHEITLCAKHTNPPLIEEIIKEVDIEIAKYMGTSTHGNCCTCQTCKNYHDDCECSSIFTLNELKKRLGDK